jgi:hypothetical protein
VLTKQRPRWLRVGLSVLAGCGFACTPRDDGSIDLFSGTTAATQSDCRSDDDCPRSQPYCHPELAHCVECLASRHCDHGACDTQTFQCVECIRNEDCDEWQGICLDGRCVECVTDEDCGRDQAVCDPESHECVRGCQSDADCDSPERPVCDPDLNRCVACVSDADCGAQGERCYEGQCLECLDDSDCWDRAPYCDDRQGECVDCLQDEHCPDRQECIDHHCVEALVG